MIKYIVIGLVLFLGAVIHPELRARMIPYAKPVLDPGIELLAKTKLDDISNQLEAQADAGRPLPDAKSVDHFLTSRYSGSDAANDPWGNPYFVTGKRGFVQIASAGRDGERNTGDDLLSRAVKAPPR